MKHDLELFPFVKVKQEKLDYIIENVWLKK
jgi:hypothetical protein